MANFNRSQFPLHLVMLLGPGGCMSRDSHARKVLAPNKMVWLNICLPTLYLSGLWKFPWRDTFLSGTAGSACELTLSVRLLCCWQIHTKRTTIGKLWTSLYTWELPVNLDVIRPRSVHPYWGKTSYITRLISVMWTPWSHVHKPRHTVVLEQALRLSLIRATLWWWVTFYAFLCEVHWHLYTPLPMRRKCCNH